MADNSVDIVVHLDDKQAQQELNRLTKKIESLRAQIKSASDARLPLVQQAEELGVQLDNAKAKLEEMQNAAPGTYTSEQIASQKETVNSLQYQWDAIQKQVEGYDRQIAKANATLAQNEERAGELAEQLSGVGESGSQAGGALSDAMRNAASRVEKLGHRIGGLIKRVFVFSLITRALRELRKWLSETAKGNSEVATAIGSLKGSLLTLAQPIFSSVIPAFVALLNVLNKVVSAIAYVFSALFGTTISASADAAKGLQEEKDALEGVGGAAEDASKQMADFDEINKLEEDKGGGGGGGGADAIAPLFDAISNFKMPEWVDALLESLKITIDDVFIDWDNLTGEQIAEKVITGLFALAGGALGFTLGGVPGAIIGTLTGIALSLVFNALTFNHDGKLNGSEILALLRTAILALFGAGLGSGVAAAIGASAVTGGLIGLAVGVGLSLVIQAIKWAYDQKITERAHESELGALIYAGLEDSVATLEAATELKLNIESITGEIPEDKLAELERARDLIDDIFTLNDKEYKTPGEIEVLKAKIEELNGMNLDGIQVEFDETTNSVLGSKDALLKNLDALQRTYQMEAMHDAIVEQYENEFKAKKQVRDTTKELKTAVEDHTAAVEAAKAAEDDYQAALDNYLIAYQNETEEYNRALEALVEAEQKRDAANVTLEESKKRVENLSEALETSCESYALAQESVAELEKEHENLIKEISNSADKAKSGGKDIMEGERAGLEEGYPDTEDFLKKAQEALQEAANEVNGINSPSTVYAEMGKYMMEGVANGITDNAYLANNALTIAMNGLISIAERGVNNIASSFNNSVGRLNTLAADMGVTIPYIPTVSVPRLAAGAVIPPNREFLALLGDQKSGTNIEAPLDTIVAAFRQALSESGGGQRELVLQVGEYEFARLVFDMFNAESGRVGMSMVT